MAAKNVLGNVALKYIDGKMLMDIASERWFLVKKWNWTGDTTANRKSVMIAFPTNLTAVPTLMVMLEVEKTTNWIMMSMNFCLSQKQ